MALKKMASKPKGVSKVKKVKQPTQFTAQERVKVMGPTGKLRLEWRDR